MKKKYIAQNTTTSNTTPHIYLGPAVIQPQYYGVQTPWGIYPANLIQQGQGTPQGIQQQMRGGSGRLTPSGQSDSGSQIQQPLQPPQGTVDSYIIFTGGLIFVFLAELM